MGEMHEMYGRWDNGEYNPMDGDFEPGGTCLGCDEEFESPTARLFCSQECREEARVVRYVRRCLTTGRIDDPDVQDAVTIRMAHVLGGYDARSRRVSPERRAEVTERQGGRCARCGEPGTEIDHILDDSGDPENLQLLCHDCHMQKSLASLVEITPEDERYADVDRRGQALLERIHAPKPLRACDDPDTWEKAWPALLQGRRENWS